MNFSRAMSAAALSAIALALGACASDLRQSGAGVTAAINAAIDSPDRPAKDRDLDAARKPREMLAFIGIAPGMKVIDLFTGGGWYAELEARVTGPGGEVYAHNPPEFLAKFSDKAIVERLANNRLPTVRRWDHSLDALELPAAHFDGAVANDVFHDFFWLSRDVDGVIRQVYGALKPGGFFAIIDHSAPAGTGDSYARDFKGQHRIDEDLVKQKLLAAGFRLAGESQVLRNPDDDRSKPFFAPEMKGKNTDKFALVFVKPR